MHLALSICCKRRTFRLCGSRFLLLCNEDGLHTVCPPLSLPPHTITTWRLAILPQAIGMVPTPITKGAWLGTASSTHSCEQGHQQMVAAHMPDDIQLHSRLVR
jgi:hypothetical protein